MPKLVPVNLAVALDTSDLKFLKDREKVVSEGVKASIAASKALHEIRAYKDGKLWKATHETFEAYCRAKWGYAKTHAYQLATSGELIHQIEEQSVASHSAIAEWMPTNESQLRPLLKLPPDRRVECWALVVAQTKPGELTQKIVKVEMGKFAKAQGLPLASKKAKPRLSDKKKAAAALGKLRVAIAALPDADKFAPLLEKIKELIG